VADIKADAPYIGEFGDYLRLNIQVSFEESIEQAQEYGCVKSGFTGLLYPLQPAMDWLSGLAGQTGQVMTRKLEGTYHGLFATANEYAGVEKNNYYNFKNMTSSSTDGLGGTFARYRPKGHFTDAKSVMEQPPEVETKKLSDVMEGEHWGTDAINWFYENFISSNGKGLYDELILPLTGDFNRINANGAAWKHAGEMFWNTSANLSANATKLVDDHWSDGKASKAFHNHVELAWTPVLLIARESCNWMGKGFEAIAKESIKAADKCAELLNRILTKITTLAIKRLNAYGFATSLANVGVKWFMHGFKLEGKDFPFWGDVIEIKDIIQAVMHLHETIKQMVEAIKKYFDGFKQVMNAASQIPDIDSTHKAVDVADGFRSGSKAMKDAQDEYKKSEKEYDKQLKDLDKKVNQSVTEND
jgi:hypothetical protein